MDPFEKKRLLPIEVMIALAINIVVAILGYYAIMPCRFHCRKPSPPRDSSGQSDLQRTAHVEFRETGATTNGALVMSDIPLHLQRRFEQRWAARFVPPAASTAPKSIDLKRPVHNLPRIAKAKEKSRRVESAGLICVLAV
jgi:hypothetical protein